MTDPSALPRPPVLVLAGGNALGAFQAGAYQALYENGVLPDWIVGASIGAVNGALIVGNPVERRLEALQAFWSKAALPTGPGWGSAPAIFTELRRLYGQTQAMLFGSPAVFTPNYAGLMASEASAVGVYSLDPLRRSLERLVDFERLNRGDTRFSVVATDLETGAEVLFDTREGWIGPDHIVASSALLPEFRPVEIEGRLLGDGGLTSNQPLDVVWRERDRDGVCIAVDLFNPVSRRFNTVGEAMLRRNELFFTSQSRRILEAYEREDRLRDALRAALTLNPEDRRDTPDFQTARRALAERPPLKIVRLVWRSGEEVGNYLYDYSDVAVATRWKAGERAAAEALQAMADSQQ
jgi:NTE family protein